MIDFESPQGALDEDRRLRSNAEIRAEALGRRIDEANALLDSYGVDKHPGNLNARIEQLAKRLLLSQQEVERWRHGDTIEGDFICPDSLDLNAAEKVIDNVRSSLEWIEGEGREDIVQAIRDFDHRRDVL